METTDIATPNELFEALDGLKEEFLEGLKKYEAVDWFFSRSIRSRLRLKHWYFNPLASKILLDRAEHLNPLLGVSPEFKEFSASIRKNLASGYRLDDQANDAIQHLLGLKWLIDNGYGDFKHPQKRRGVKKPDFLCKKAGYDCLVEVKNVQYPKGISNLLNSLTLLYNKITTNETSLNFELSNLSESYSLNANDQTEYESVIDYTARNLAGLLIEYSANPEKFKDWVRVAWPDCIPKSTCSEDYLFRARVDRFVGVGHVSGPVLDPIPTEPYERALRKFKEKVKEALGQCISYRSTFLSACKRVKFIILVNIVIDEQLILNEDELRAELCQVASNYTRWNSALEVYLMWSEA
jgi:hypothetical protein